MSGPRNKPAFERGQRHRAAIRAAWLELLERKPFDLHTAAHVLRLLPPEFGGLSVRCVQWHLQRIRFEAEQAELGCAARNSSGADSVSGLPRTTGEIPHG